jgi:hypothetical protein
MQTCTLEKQIIDDNSLFPPLKRKNARTRKWREIEDIIAQQRLSRELQEIDQSFVFSLSDLV